MMQLQKESLSDNVFFEMIGKTGHDEVAVSNFDATHTNGISEFNRVTSGGFSVDMCKMRLINVQICICFVEN